MEILRLRIKLLSDATFGRGDGVPGLVDQEVDHDEDGFVFLGGRALKGLLAEEGRNLLFVLHESLQAKYGLVHDCLFGKGGSGLGGESLLDVETARLSQALRQSLTRNGWKKEQILDALTGIRRQTAVDARSGAPQTGSLRAIRVVMRDLVLESKLRTETSMNKEELIWLCVCALALRRAGTRRNRGRGKIRVTVENEGFMKQRLHEFRKEVSDASPTSAAEASATVARATR